MQSLSGFLLHHHGHSNATNVRNCDQVMWLSGVLWYMASTSQTCGVAYDAVPHNPSSCVNIMDWCCFSFSISTQPCFSHVWHPAQSLLARLAAVSIVISSSLQGLSTKICLKCRPRQTSVWQWLIPISKWCTKYRLPPHQLQCKSHPALWNILQMSSPQLQERPLDAYL